MKSNVIQFPFERTKRYKELNKRMKDATSWWPSKAEQAREAHRAAMGYAPRKPE